MSNLVKAIQIEENGGPEVLKLVEIEVPAPGENEITIRQHAAGLNFIDIYFRTGLYKSAMPSGLGFEGAGEVIAVDAGVDTGSDAGTDARVDGSRDRGAARRGRRGQAHVPDRGGSEEYDVE